jgi:hypothetical protein
MRSSLGEFCCLQDSKFEAANNCYHDLEKQGYPSLKSHLYCCNQDACTFQQRKEY